ncbi:MAG: insulinase family protein, partial [Pontimonas sp.]
DTRMVRLGRSEIHTGEFVDRTEALRRLDLVTLDSVQDVATTFAAGPLSAVAVGALSDTALDSVGSRVAE